MAPTGDQRHSDLAQLLVTSALLVGIEEATAAADRAARPRGHGQRHPVPADRGARSAAAQRGPGVGPRPRRRSATRRRPPPRPRCRRWPSCAGRPSRPCSRPPSSRPRPTSSSARCPASTSPTSGTRSRMRPGGSSWSPCSPARPPGSPRPSPPRGACPRPVAYGPLVLLQFGISFINLVLPSTAARVAVNIRFFQRQGIPPASAVSIGVIDSLGGFAVQLLILASVLLFGFGDVHLDMPADSRPRRREHPHDAGRHRRRGGARRC